VSNEKNIDKGRRDFSQKAVIIAGVSALVIFAVILCAVESGHAAVFDDTVRYFFYGMRCEPLTAAVKIITYMGNWQTITLLCIVLLIFRFTRITYGIPVSAGAIAVTLLNKLIKHLAERPRPDDITHLISEGGFSFPSGHAITSMFVFGILIYLVRANVKNRVAANVLTVVLAVPMICIGLSRIYLGVHYPTDVAAGWCLGIAVMAAVILICGHFQRRSQ